MKVLLIEIFLNIILHFLTYLYSQKSPKLSPIKLYYTHNFHTYPFIIIFYKHDIHEVCGTTYFRAWDGRTDVSLSQDC